ncbi:xanthine dehydrogenase family protein molybdopterin-binding subunit [Rhizobium mayense]|uniref:Xanthine dehydrogenase family protein molybdopterin-binding subunit n=1 Tax=Rhizobium mayense TaxID=1312184 RepID=A0ABT7K035_9HYPH|nr:xanthine dehydrogenase family protein molybdopterin-binding subunit [Rhizobium mayense]MDL2401970.1 xanthine dehydrogenase family protein molybdopterin-binding subunit [Rhizobium mayense]
MLFNSPAPRNPIDNETVVSHPHVRIDGPLKVSGQARYAYEYNDEIPNAAYGFILGAGIATGSIRSIDTNAAESAPGVLLVLTYKNAPKQGDDGSPQLQGADIKHYDQAIAFVVAETFEQARAAARLIKIEYTKSKGAFDLNAVKDTGSMTRAAADTHMGDFQKAFSTAAASVDVTYTTPNQSHSMMEPHASIAKWDGDKLTVYMAHQIIHSAQANIADTFGIPQDNVRVVSAYIGGGFGSKLVVYADPILAAMAARQLGRPVKVALTRPQIYNHTTHRAATIQRLRLGAGPDGRLTAVGHQVWCGNQPGHGPENAAAQTKLLYPGDNRWIETRLSELDLPIGAAMRAPGEAAGLLALECAMDELAEKLNIDPVELRIRNDIQYDPEVGPSRPFSTRKLVQCMQTGAERFGWSKRNPKPGQVRNGEWLVGIGVAAAIRNNPVRPSGARATIDRNGILTIETQQTDIGTGSYTILAMIGAEMLGLPVDSVRVKLGDSDFPEAAGSGGSFGANSSSTGVYYTCSALRDEIVRRSGLNTTDVSFSDGSVISQGRSIRLADIAGDAGISAEEKAEFGDLQKKFAQAAFGAHFAEVGVDIATGEIRVRRMLSVCAAGRIINPMTARSQCLGGMTMGIGAALMEECIVDKRYGYFVNHDLAEYQVPVHADIPDLDVVFLDEVDDQSSPIRAKGIGELGICGVGAAVANAVYNACGVRVRDYPLTMDKIIAGLPPIG